MPFGNRTKVPKKGAVWKLENGKGIGMQKSTAAEGLGRSILVNLSSLTEAATNGLRKEVTSYCLITMIARKKPVKEKDIIDHMLDTIDFIV